MSRDLAAIRRGPRRWVASYRAMFAFDLASQRRWIMTTAVFQTLMGAGIAMSYGIFLGHVPHRTAEFIATGAPTLAFIPVGLVMLPGLISRQRAERTFDFIWSLPVPRTAAVASTLSVFSLIAVPGAAATLVVTALRYHPALSPTLALLPAVVLAALMTTSVGYGMAHLIDNPVVTNLITNVLIFFVILFTPIAFPASQYPSWLVRVQSWLPLYPMARVVRAALQPGLIGAVGGSYLVLAVWTAASWTAVAWVVGRRH